MSKSAPQFAVGQKIGPYEVLARLGAGGMGEVWKARDSRLGREVAIKFSQEQFSKRFDREARAVAALNHPNICHLYDVGPNYLVMELVEGPILADRIQQGPVPLDEALSIAGQITDALDAAHQSGIIHRDLKPDNIKLRPDGTVKVLDFGLARMDDVLTSEGANPTESLTLSLTATQSGIILGTAAYMSPEQARGKTVDKRTDIWAFGVTVYEMLTGRQLFNGPTVSDTLAAVLKDKPDFSSFPASVGNLLRWCLEKDPQRRLRDIGDVRKLLELPLVSSEPLPSRRLRSRIILWIGVAAVLAVLAAARWIRPQPTAVASPSLALSLLPSSGTRLSTVGSAHATPEISPDGSSIVYWRSPIGITEERLGPRLEVRRLDSFEPLLIRGSEGASGLEFWSPDSMSVAFPALTELKSVRVPDGAPEVIAHLPGLTAGGTWSNQGMILLASLVSGRTSLFAVSASGGTPRRVNIPGVKDGDFLIPQFMPGSEDFLVPFLPNGAEQLEVYLVSLRNGAASDSVLLFKNETAPHYTSAGGGRVLFVRNDNLYTQRLDLPHRKLAGYPVLLERGVASAPGDFWAHFSVSSNGIVAWRPGRAGYVQLTVFDRRGKPVGTAGPPMSINAVRLSPDEKHVLVDSPSGDWLVDRDRPGRQSLGKTSWLLWSRDGSSLLGLEGTRLVERNVNDAETVRELSDASADVILEDVSPDNRMVLLNNHSALLLVNLNDPASKRFPRPILQTGEVINGIRFSPDGRLVVYRTRTPQNQSLGIYVQPFPNGGLRTQISRTGNYPVWRGDGKEILYYDQDRIWSVAVDTTGGHLNTGVPQPLFSVRPPPRLVVGLTPLAVSRDGSRIFFPQATEQPDWDVIRIRTGWFDKNR